MKNINVNSTEVFKFFVQREPEKHSTNNLTYIFIESSVSELVNPLLRVIDESKTNQRRIANEIVESEHSILESFIREEDIELKVDDHNKLVKDLELEADQKLRNLSSIINNFTNSERFVTNFDKLKLKSLRLIVAWLTNENKKTELSVYKDKIYEVFSQSAESLMNSTEFQQDKSNVYNSLLSLNFFKTSEPGLKNNLFTLARVINFIELIGNNDTSLISEDGVAANPLESEIVIPTGIFDQNITTAQYYEFADSITTNDRIRKLATRLKDLNTASMELSKVKTNQLKVREKPSSQTVQRESNIQQQSKKIGGPENIEEADEVLDLVLSEEGIKNLSDTTKKLLHDEHTPLDSTPFTDLIPMIEKNVWKTRLSIDPTLGPGTFRDAEETIKSINNVVLRMKSSTRSTGLLPDFGLVDKGPPDYPPFVSGIGDLKKVKDRTVKFVFGEPIHVENILMGEKKERTHRKLNRTEETVVLEERITEDITNYMESIDRFELQKASNEVIQSENRLDFGVNISGGYGPFFQASSYLDVGIGSNKQKSIEFSSSIAKKTIEKSLEKIQKKINEKRITKLFQEIEETNFHTLDNTARNTNIHGLYQCLDKVACGELYVYDKRLLVEVILGDPAFFYKSTFKRNAEKAMKLRNANKILPPEPIPFKWSVLDINEFSYALIASFYDVEVSPPPPRYIWHTETFKQEQFIQSEDVKTDSVTSFVAERRVQVPEGYKVIGRSVRRLWKTDDLSDTDTDFDTAIIPPASFGAEGSVGIIVRITHVKSYSCAVGLWLERTDNLFSKWKLDTYKKIHQEYLNQKSLYDSKLSELAISEDMSIEIVGNNPLFNRETEKVELKKGAIMMLTKNHLANLNGFYNFDWPGKPDDRPDYDYPYMDFNRTRILGRQVLFFEQALETHNMLYTFYSYFWGLHGDWEENLFRSDVDPLFNNFLKAGAARVVFPVRPGFEKAVLYFLRTGIIWEGKDVPVIGDPMYVDIVEEMKEKLDLLDYDGRPEDIWTYKMPTPLVYLRENDLSDTEENLPSWESCEDILPPPEG